MADILGFPVHERVQTKHEGRDDQSERPNPPLPPIRLDVWRQLMVSDIGGKRRSSPAIAQKMERKYNGLTIGIFDSLTPGDSPDQITGLEISYRQQGYTTCVAYNLLSPQQEASYQRLVNEIEATGDTPRTKGLFICRGSEGKVISSVIHVWLKPEEQEVLETSEEQPVAEEVPTVLTLGYHLERIDNFTPLAQDPPAGELSFYEQQALWRSRGYVKQGYTTRVTYDYDHKWQQFDFERCLQQIEKMYGRHAAVIDGWWVTGELDKNGRKLVHLWVKPEWLT